MPETVRPKPVILVILDGWGIASPNQGNAITQAKIPFFQELLAIYPHTSLAASGEAVGLPAGEDGNTETGHLNMGAGLIVYQDLLRINQAIASGSYHTNPQFLGAINHAQKNHSTLHLLGLVGAGNVHSNSDHLYALLYLCQKQNFTNVALHLITDGRDSPPTSGINFILQVKSKLAELGFGRIATITGRYYAMDRDHHWDRTGKTYEALVQSKGPTFQKPEECVLSSYRQNVTDEFIEPSVMVDPDGNPICPVKDNDSVIFFNYRIDRPRQLTKAFVIPNFEYVLASNTEGFDPYAIKYYKSHLATAPDDVKTASFTRGPLLKNLYFVTMTEYEKGLPANVAFPPEVIEMPLGKVVADMGLRQLHMAETEKERFVTYYFNGQREDPFPGEDRIIIPSPPVPTYDQKPEMSSRELTQTLVERLETNLYDFVVVNYANPDMVAHTGNLKATITACEITDQNLKNIVEVVNRLGGVTLVTADHGNAEEVINLKTGEVDTEHSGNPVPFLIISEHYKNTKPVLHPGILADIAPTVLSILNLPKPATMSGRALV